MNRKDTTKTTIRDRGAKNQDMILSGSFLFFSTRRLLTAFAGSSPGKLVFANSNAASYTVHNCLYPTFVTIFLAHLISKYEDIKESSY